MLTRRTFVSHTLVADVGRIATQAGVKKLVLCHLVPVPFTGMSDHVWIDAVRPTWAGELVVAHDLTEIAL